MDDANFKPYNMSHESRGPVLIFNNVSYHDKAWHLKDRAFSDVDTAKMVKCLKSLGYKDIRMKRDLTAASMLDEVKRVAAENLTDADSVVLVFLAYGEDNLIYAKDRPVGIQILIDPLKGDVCHKSIVGKPKIIILQTCNPTQMAMENDSDEKEVIRVIPAEADFIFLGSDVPGLLTGRDVTDGSIFIDNLSRCLQDRGDKEEMCLVMTKVIQKCAQEMDRWKSDWENENDGRIPYMINMLTRELCFKKTKAMSA